MIDIHTHILPDLDDGPETIEESLAMAKAAWENGTQTLVATPHVLNRLSLANNTIIVDKFKEFKRLLSEQLPQFQLLLGSEIYFQPNLADFARYDAGTLNATRAYMLIEFPMGDVPRGFEYELGRMRNANVIPVVAHPERNILVLDKPALVGKMVEAGALTQLNAGSLTGVFGNKIAKLAQNLLKKGWAHVIASDAHGLNHRGPDLQLAFSAAAEVIGVAAARRLVEDHPNRIVTGAPWLD